MPITDEQYYTLNNNIFIPNLQGTGYGNTKLDEFNQARDTIERQLLIDAIGYTYTTELLSALDDLPNADQKYIDLVEGKTYVIDSVVYNWDGLRGYNYNSLVAFFVYFNYSIGNKYHNTTTGWKLIKDEGSVNVGFSYKQRNAFNAFIDMYQNDSNDSDVAYLTDDYGCIIGIDYYAGKERTRTNVTLETYLDDHSDDFENISIKKYERLNGWGIL